MTFLCFLVKFRSSLSMQIQNLISYSFIDPERKILILVHRVEFLLTFFFILWLKLVRHIIFNSDPKYRFYRFHSTNGKWFFIPTSKFDPSSRILKKYKHLQNSHIFASTLSLSLQMQTLWFNTNWPRQIWEKRKPRIKYVKNIKYVYLKQVYKKY